MDHGPGIFGILYGAGGIITTYLAFKWGSRRFLKWLKANGPETVEDWIFVPILGVLGLGMVGIGLSFTFSAWPVVAWVLYQERQRGRALRLRQVEDEHRELLEEVKRLNGLNNGDG